ncbi:hypothetical protein ACQP2X_39465 [Actinoplanes sp. CA-131856]
MVERVQVPWVVVWRWVLLGLAIAWSAGMVGFAAANGGAIPALIFSVWSVALLAPPFATQNRQSSSTVCIVAALADLGIGFVFAFMGLFLFWPLVIPLVVAAFLPPRLPRWRQSEGSDPLHRVGAGRAHTRSGQSLVGPFLMTDRDRQSRPEPRRDYGRRERRHGSESECGPDYCPYVGPHVTPAAINGSASSRTPNLSLASTSMKVEMAERAYANPAGLPRPRSDGRPIPWITQVRTTGPEWRRIDSSRLLACQVDWRCQSCGLRLPRAAYSIVNLEREVLSHAPLCRPCTAAALRWCPGLTRTDHLTVMLVTPDDITADDQPLLYRWNHYGEETRTWKVSVAVPTSVRQVTPSADGLADGAGKTGDEEGGERPGQNL